MDKESLFMDVEGIEPGLDFEPVIEKAVRACDILLAFIGPTWLGPKDDGRYRIHEPNDYVRLEIVTALKRRIRVVPVLVDGAAFPDMNLIPKDLAPLAKKNWVTIDHDNFGAGIEKLLDTIERVAPELVYRDGQSAAASRSANGRRSTLFSSRPAARDGGSIREDKSTQEFDFGKALKIVGGIIGILFLWSILTEIWYGLTL